ncbi:MAG TPA: dihydropyrimidinase [Candidatus Acetothermia bacterium]|nr:dihydropyrimidinase [Candidatus Acetothermia bacterium]
MKREFYDLVIKNGTLVSPQGTLRADLGIVGEKIAAVGINLAGKREVDASGKLVLPGVIDAHTHMALPVAGTRSSDDFFTGTRAAACGGVTTIVDFTVGSADTTIPEDIKKRQQVAKDAVIDYTFHGEVVGWKPGHEAEFRDAVALGIKTFKFYTAYGSSGRRSDSGVLYHAFRAIAEHGATALVHCEDDDLITSLVNQLTEKERGEMMSLARTRPPECEGAAIEQVAYYANVTGARAHIVHVSSALGLAVVSRAKARGVQLTAETCPQYLLLTKDVYQREDAHLYSASPALRSKSDQDALWKGLRDGTLDLVATDHCPFTNAQKEWKGSFLDLPYGLPGVETLLSFLYSEGVAKKRLALTDLPRLLCEGPARINGLYPKKGALSIGSDADIVIFDPEVKWTIHADDLHMNTDFSPYEGMAVRGAVDTTISRGRIIYTDGKFQDEKGWGRFVAV